MMTPEPVESLCAIHTCRVKANEKENWTMQECNCIIPLCPTHAGWFWRRVPPNMIRDGCKYSRHRSCIVKTHK
jgi:hypothetical protein